MDGPEFIMWRLPLGAFKDLDIPDEYAGQELQPALYLEDGSHHKALLIGDGDKVVYETDLVPEVSNGGNLW